MFQLHAKMLTIVQRWASRHYSLSTCYCAKVCQPICLPYSTSAWRQCYHSEIGRNAHLTKPGSFATPTILSLPTPIFLFRRLMASKGYAQTCIQPRHYWQRPRKLYRRYCADFPQARTWSQLYWMGIRSSCWLLPLFMMLVLAWSSCHHE